MKRMVAVVIGCLVAVWLWLAPANASAKEVFPGIEDEDTTIDKACGDEPDARLYPRLHRAWSDCAVSALQERERRIETYKRSQKFIEDQKALENLNRQLQEWMMDNRDKIGKPGYWPDLGPGW